MPLDVSPHLDPRRTAVVNMECQEKLLGANSALPGLARAAQAKGLISNLANLFAAAAALARGSTTAPMSDARTASGSPQTACSRSACQITLGARAAKDR